MNGYSEQMNGSSYFVNGKEKLNAKRRKVNNCMYLSTTE
jgi:hypothetical protein